MKLHLRYVTARRRADGSQRLYWQRRGWPPVRLDGRADPVGLVDRLNARADAGLSIDDLVAEPGAKSTRRRPGPAPANAVRTASATRRPPGSIGALVEAYRASDRFKDRAPGTRQAYAALLADLEDRIGHLAARALTRQVAVAWITTAPGQVSRRRGMARLARAVLSAVIDQALNDGALAGASPLAGYRMPGLPARTRFAEAHELGALRAAAVGDLHGAGLALALELMIYTGQRPGDVLALTWSAYDGNALHLVQQKRRRAVIIPCHAELRGALDAAKADRRGVQIVGGADGRRLSYKQFLSGWHRLRQRAQCHDLQARDLRRTAVIALAEAGATIPEIAAITGHSIARTSAILATYWQATPSVARAAIRKLELRPGRTKQAQESNATSESNASQSNAPKKGK